MRSILPSYKSLTSDMESFPKDSGVPGATCLSTMGVSANELKIPMKMLDAVTLHWRIHEHNASHQNLREHARGVDRPLIEIVKHALERKRARGDL